MSPVRYPLSLAWRRLSSSLAKPHHQRGTGRCSIKRNAFNSVVPNLVQGFTLSRTQTHTRGKVRVELGRRITTTPEGIPDDVPELSVSTTSQWTGGDDDDGDGSCSSVFDEAMTCEIFLSCRVNFGLCVPNSQPSTRRW